VDNHHARRLDSFCFSSSFLDTPAAEVRTLYMGRVLLGDLLTQYCGRGQADLYAYFKHSSRIFVTRRSRILFRQRGNENIELLLHCESL
jgi:hypothetical protein